MAQKGMSGEDRFVATSLRLLEWARRNTRALVIGAIAVAILVFGVRYYVDYQATVRETASAEIRSIRYELQVGNADQIVERLRTFLAQFGGTRYAREARVLLAHSLLLQNRASEAIEPARVAASEIGADPLSTRAGFLLAAAFEEVGDTGSAIRTYEEIGRKAEPRVQVSRALEGVARLRRAQGDLAGAAGTYERLAELTPETAPAHAFYVMRAAELRAEAVRGAEAEGGGEG